MECIFSATIKIISHRWQLTYWLVKSPPWHIKSVITRWKELPANPNPIKVKLIKLSKLNIIIISIQLLTTVVSRSSYLTLFSSTKCTEVFSCFWYNISTEFHDYTSGWFPTNGDIEEYFWVRPAWRERGVERIGWDKRRFELLRLTLRTPMKMGSLFILWLITNVLSCSRVALIRLGLQV